MEIIGPNLEIGPGLRPLSAGVPGADERRVEHRLGL
jgi:hypothetical protein